MSTRYVIVAAVALASIVGSASAEDETLPDADKLADRRSTALPPADEENRSRVVRLAWTDPAGAAIGSGALARREAADLLARMGVAVSWRESAANELSSPGEVRVIVLDRGAQREPGIPVLGAIPSRLDVARSDAPPCAWVHMPGVFAALGLAPRGPLGTLEPIQRHQLAVALGRVVAHEVVHALAPDVPHGRGLMAARLTQRQLVAARIDFAPDVALAVRAALRGEASLRISDTGVLAAESAGVTQLR